MTGSRLRVWEQGEAKNMSEVKTDEIATPTYTTYVSLYHAADI